MKIVGLVQAKNEWPLLALSISHALMNHVDEVFVLNHGSTDGTPEGLKALCELWKNRIHVFHCNDERFWQEASTTALIMMSRASSPDWFYVFDADEFLLTKEPGGLKAILHDTNGADCVVRYQVENWISTEDFDEHNIDHYRMLRYRSVPGLFVEMHPETLADEVLHGNLNFYDVPFPSKIIFRDNGASWPAAGSHFLKTAGNTKMLSLEPGQLRCAHFPLLSRKKLDRKSIHGERKVRDGFPAWHGWQTRIIYQLSQENRLGEFWEAHSISSRQHSLSRTLPTSVVEDSFAEAIEPTIRLLENGLRSNILGLNRAADFSPEESRDTLVPFTTMVLLARRLQSAMDPIILERDAAVRERDALINSRSWRYTQFVRRIIGWVHPSSKPGKNRKA